MILIKYNSEETLNSEYSGNYLTNSPGQCMWPIPPILHDQYI